MTTDDTGTNLDQQVTLRLPNELYSEVAQRAEELDRSISWYIRNMLTVGLERLRPSVEVPEDYDGPFSTYGALVRMQMPRPKGNLDDELRAVDRVLSAGLAAMYPEGATGFRVEGPWHEAPLGTMRGAVAEAVEQRIGAGDYGTFKLVVQHNVVAESPVDSTVFWPKVLRFESPMGELDFPEIRRRAPWDNPEGLAVEVEFSTHYIPVTDTTGQHGYLTFTWSQANGERWFAGGVLQARDDDGRWTDDQLPWDLTAATREGDPEAIYGPFVLGWIKPR